MHDRRTAPHRSTRTTADHGAASGASPVLPSRAASRSPSALRRPLLSAGRTSASVSDDSQHTRGSVEWTQSQPPPDDALQRRQQQHQHQGRGGSRRLSWRASLSPQHRLSSSDASTGPSVSGARPRVSSVSLVAQRHADMSAHAAIHASTGSRGSRTSGTSGGSHHGADSAPAQQVPMSNRSSQRRGGGGSGSKAKSSRQSLASEPSASGSGGGGDGDDVEPPRVATVGESNMGYTHNRIATSKYTALSFVPRSLFEQFRRVANIYFLGISVLMMLGTYIPALFESPLTPFSTLGPLVLVLAITMVKEGLEDLKRHRSDVAINNRTAHVLRRSGAVEAVHWIDLRVGDVVRVDNKSEVPADMVVLWAPGEGGQCYIETSNIDGETNLKIRASVPAVQSACERGWADLADVAGKLTYEAPNASIHTFEGVLDWRPATVGGRRGAGASQAVERVPLGPRNLLLRGCTLRNTRFVWGVAVYTGGDTKVMRKSGGARSKLSQVERLVNRCIRIIFLTQFTLCTISTVCLVLWDNIHDGSVPYLHEDSSKLLLPSWLGNWFTFLILYNNFIPISLYVTMEMINYLQGFFIDNDREMYDPEADMPAKARTSNLAEDLGQIQYVFSDKTGTLTRNEMEFRMASIGGQVYGSFDGDDDGAAAAAAPAVGESSFQDPVIHSILARRDHPQHEAVHAFFACLALCHTVVVDQADPTDDGNASAGAAGAYKPPSVASEAARAAGGASASGRGAKLGEGLTYQAESPDEGALTTAAGELGFVFLARTSTSITVATPDTPRPHAYKLFGVHAFTSDRKRMSVVVQSPDGQYLLLAKGADNVIFGLANTSQSDNRVLNGHLTLFASKGLRTLVVAQRALGDREFHEWRQQYTVACNQVNGRDEALARVAAAYERDLHILGATAIEDKLQEGVPRAIADLARAGIKTWVLTGDKVETAINIGHSCRLLNSDMEIVKITSPDRETVSRQLASLARTFRPLVEDPRSFVRRLMKTVSESIPRIAHRDTNSSHGSGTRSSGQGKNARSSGARSSGGKHGAHLTENPLRPETQAQANGNGAAGYGATGPPSSRSADGSSMRRPASQRSVQEPDVNAADSLAVVVTGEALRHILGHPKAERQFLTVARLCKSVVACRVSPAQKAEVVKLVRRNTHPKPMCLAIGDGANDVNMIQAAQVGVGISGREGQQAVNASDFAISQFRFLRRLLLVHGRWSYVRMSKAVLYSFYKNIVLTLTLFFFTFSTGFSGTSLYESLVYSGFNFFLGLPIFGVGFLDRDISADNCLAHPVVYLSGRQNMLLNMRKMAQWIVHAIIHAIIIYFVPFFAWRTGGTWNQDGVVDGMYCFGTTVYTCLIFAMNWKLCQVATTWTWINHLLFWVSLLGYFLFIFVYSLFPTYAPEFYGVAVATLAPPVNWLVVLLVVATCVVFDFAVENVRLQLFPTPIDVAVEIDRGKSELGWQDPFDEDNSDGGNSAVDGAGSPQRRHSSLSSAGTPGAATGTGESRTGAGVAPVVAATGTGTGHPRPSHASSSRGPRMRLLDEAEAKRAAAHRRARSATVTGSRRRAETPTYSDATEHRVLAPRAGGDGYSITREGLSRMMAALTPAERQRLGIAPHERTGYDFSGTSSAFGPGGGRMRLAQAARRVVESVRESKREQGGARRGDV